MEKNPEFEIGPALYADLQHGLVKQAAARVLKRQKNKGGSLVSFDEPTLDALKIRVDQYIRDTNNNTTEDIKLKLQFWAKNMRKLNYAAKCSF